jgi:plastocyanin
MRLKNKAIFCTLALAPAALSCFSESDDVTGPAPEFVSCDTNAPAPPDNARLIRIRNFAFSPAQLNIPAGTTVWWINCENAGAGNAHTTTSNTGVWDSPLLQPAGVGTYSRRFDNAGAFPYHCTPHPNMTATITVT